MYVCYRWINILELLVASPFLTFLTIRLFVTISPLSPLAPRPRPSPSPLSPLPSPLSPLPSPLSPLPSPLSPLPSPLSPLPSPSPLSLNLFLPVYHKQFTSQIRYILFPNIFSQIIFFLTLFAVNFIFVSCPVVDWFCDVWLIVDLSFVDCLFAGSIFGEDLFGSCWRGDCPEKEYKL